MHSHRKFLRCRSSHNQTQKCLNTYWFWIQIIAIKLIKNELIIFETEHILIPPTNFSDEMKCYQSFYSRQIVTCTACTLSTTRHSPYKFLHTQELRMCYDVPQVIPAGWFRIRNMNLLLTTTRLARIEVPTKLWRKVMTQIHLGTKSNNTRMPI